jgi:hypothetical protein
MLSHSDQTPARLLEKKKDVFFMTEVRLALARIGQMNIPLMADEEVLYLFFTFFGPHPHLGGLPSPQAKKALQGNNAAKARDAVVALRSPAHKKVYLWPGDFDWLLVEKGVKKYKAKLYIGSKTLPNLQVLVDFLEDDEEIVDIRWMAYILATVWKETGTMAPVEEGEKLRAKGYYSWPVKVETLLTGEVKVTEQDGDQFTVQSNGRYTAVNKGAKTGSEKGRKYTCPVSKTYTDAKGTELAFYGRGYVQLTWWENYAKAGVNQGAGLAYLTNPKLVMEPATAYAIMTLGMRTGKGFANGHKLSDYISGTECDYVGARHMVNGTDCAQQIAGIAQVFEDILYDARDLS